MSSFYDKYGGNPSYISVSASYSDNNKIIPTVPIFKGSTEEVKKTPNFKTLFEDYKLHNPDEHRAYLFVPFPFEDNRIWDNYMAGSSFTSHKSEIKPFDETKIEFQTVLKDNVEYLAPSTDYVSYLKQQDEAFSKTVTELTYYRNHFTNIWNGLPNYQKYQSPTFPNHHNAMASYNAELENVNNQFKSFIADTSRKLIKLNTPFYATVSDVDYDIPVSIGNFNAYELDKFICSVFGNVTDDEFIPSVNEEIYNAKTSTGCCLKVCMTKELYRKEGVSYEQSQDKVQDDIEFQKWLNSDEFTPYVPPAPYKEITIDKYLTYLNDAQSFARSPLKYVFEKFKPFLEKALSELKNGGYITSYKVNRNGDVDVYLNGAEPGQYEEFLEKFRRGANS